MATRDARDNRLKFYGLDDYGTYFQLERAAEVLERFDPTSTAYTVSDILELHNAKLFAENNLFPKSYTDSQREAGQALIPELRKTVGKFFGALTDDNIGSIIVDVDFQYHTDLLELFARNKVYERCAAAIVLPVLDRVRVSLGEMLANQRLVRTYDQELHARLMSVAANAEHLVRKYLEEDVRRDVYLPPSFTREDARALVEAYLDSDDANANFVELIATAHLNKDMGLDAKLKLKAKRKHARWTEDFFKENSGIKAGCEVAIADEQAEPVEASLDGLEGRYSYSRRWLEDSLDYPTILNNFLYLFEFADRRMLLTLPSYQAQLGIFDRFMRTAGKDAYLIGAAFRHKEQASSLQTLIYENFLRSKDIDLESVIAWFFADYLDAEFGAADFKYVPSTRASTYLEKCRHLFAEMESVVKQFGLYVENGELDTGLLGIASEQVRYKTVPSLMAGKYAYLGSSQEIYRIMRLLFSDQSGLAYISEDVKANDAARLLIGNRVAYDDFADHQKREIDYLIEQGLLENTGERVQIANADQFLVLKDLFDHEAASYYHYPPQTRAVIDEMVAKGWLARRASLLTEAEGSYFNYCLNQLEFSNGPDLRNKYGHGSHVDAADEDEHHRTYITALKLLVALVIKINDDFCLRDDEKSHEQAG